MKFSDILKNLREETNITQLELSKNIHVSRSDISKYENEKKDPPKDVIIDIAKYFGVSIEYLLGVQKVVENSNVYNHLYLKDKLVKAIEKAAQDPNKYNIEYMDRIYNKIKDNLTK